MNAQMLFVGGDFVLWWVCYVGLYFPPLFSLKVWVDPPYIGDWTPLPAIITKRERERCDTTFTFLPCQWAIRLVGEK